VLHRVEGIRVEPRGEGIIDEEMRDGEQAGITGVFDAVALERAEIVGVAELGAELFEDFPVALLTLRADLLFQMVLEVVRNAVIVEQGVVDVEEEDEVRHKFARIVIVRDFGFGLERGSSKERDVAVLRLYIESL
jgi:hypothetical protein